VGGNLYHRRRLPNTLNAHKTNGGAPLTQVDNLIIEAGGVLAADAAGFAGSPAGVNGKGTGGATADSHAAGYGGRGGGSGGGIAYGSSTRRLTRAAGPGWSTVMGGNGGGAIRVLAQRDVTVNGMITANGFSTTGAGSGGGIYIRCRNLGGTNAASEIRAKGGDGGGYDPSGGGGRIGHLPR